MNHTRETWTIHCHAHLTTSVYPDRETAAEQLHLDHADHLDMVTVSVTGWRQLQLALNMVSA